MLPTSLTSLLLIALCALVVAEDTHQINNSSLLWGPYRPNLYFGVRPKIPKTLLMGLMWANVDTHESIPRSMHFS
jgi:mannosyl-oligosaccharide glucosidase